MTRSEELYQRSLKVAPGGVHSPVRAFKSVGGTPVFFDRAEGAYLHSVDGDRYIDFCQSFGPNLLGHRDPEVAEAVSAVMNKAWSFGACEPYSLELGEWITGRLDFVDKVRFVSSGTEAVMSALRLARAATGRSLTLKFEGCYHGHVDNMLVKAGSGLAGVSAADSAGVPPEMAALTLTSPLDDDAALEQVFSKYGKQMAAVIIEPLPANFGLLVQRPEFLARIISLAKESGALVIFDEVISGFRVSLGGMAEKLNLKPDLVTYGKVIGGGFPVGCYAGRSELMDEVAPAGPVYQAGTLSANPVSISAGLATLKKMERLDIWKTLEVRMSDFAARINKRFRDEDLSLQVTHFASLFWIHQRSDTPIRNLQAISANQSENFKAFFHACLKRKLYLAPSGFEVGFLALPHDTEILAAAEDLLTEAAREVYGKL